MLAIEEADTRFSFWAAVHRLQTWPTANYRERRFYDAVGRVSDVPLLIVFPLMTPMGLQEDVVDLL